jgi:hypothetical protein
VAPSRVSAPHDTVVDANGRSPRAEDALRGRLVRPSRTEARAAEEKGHPFLQSTIPIAHRHIHRSTFSPTLGPSMIVEAV